MKTIATIKNGFDEKFGIPRQSGLTNLTSEIVFQPEFRVKEAFYRLEEFSHLWIIWKFSLTERDTWSPTVRPPKLGGNERVGVFASRSPFRPNPIGLSCVKLLKIDYEAKNGPVLIISGADLANDTPIFDIKPYIPYTDCQPEATGGYAVTGDSQTVKVQFSNELIINPALKDELTQILKYNPKPGYKKESDRIYKMSYAGKTVCFVNEEQTITVLSVE